MSQDTEERLTISEDGLMNFIFSRIVVNTLGGEERVAKIKAPKKRESTGARFSSKVKETCVFVSSDPNSKRAIIDMNSSPTYLDLKG